jgi:hypothetical protein
MMQWAALLGLQGLLRLLELLLLLLRAAGRVGRIGCQLQLEPTDRPATAAPSIAAAVRPAFKNRESQADTPTFV